MSVGVIVTVPGGSAEQYEQIGPTVFPEDKLPDGWTIHIAGPTESGWQVINVVPSREEFETFAREQLLPAAQQFGDQPPEVTFFPIHKLLLG